MWNNGDDFHEKTGDRVRLYQPIAYSSGRQFSCHDPTASFIGGSSVATTKALCAHCHESLQDSLLVQLHVPTRQLTYQVVGCNKAACVNQIFTSQQGRQWFSVGGGGVFDCLKMSSVQNDDDVVESSTPPTTTAKPIITAPPTNNAAPEVNDWMVYSDDDDDDDNNNDNNDLEEQIAALELKTKSNTSKSSSNKQKTKQNQPSRTTKGSLPCFELHSLLEPPGKTPTKRMMDDDDDDDDDDMIGGATNSSSDAKIQQMLAKYMAEEDDEEILAALKGTSSGSGGGKSREKDERLKASDRALWAFTDRIKRSPRQVLRYAPDGIPLWSIPRPPAQQEGDKNSKVTFQQQQQRKKNKKGNKKGDSSSTTATTPIVIPKCPSCGIDRRFEFQLMPSLLHVLEVDKHAIAKSKQQEQQPTQQEDNENGKAPYNNLEDIMKDDYGGMNWGVIAIYTCPSDTCSNQEEFVVVQASVDETPRKRAGALPSHAPVFIPENQTFDPLTEDGDLQMDDDEKDDDDEDTCVDENDLVFTLDG